MALECKVNFFKKDKRINFVTFHTITTSHLIIFISTWTLSGRLILQNTHNYYFKMKAWFSFELKGLLSLRWFLLLMRLLRKKAMLQKQKSKKKKQTRKEHDISRWDKIFISWRDKCILKLNTFIMWAVRVTAEPSGKILTTAYTKHQFLEKMMQPVKATFVMFYVTKIA